MKLASALASKQSACALLPLVLILTAGCRAGEGEDPRGGRAIPASAPRAAQPASVTGTVVDASTRAPVAGVVIEGPGGLRAETDADGRFTLEGLRAGDSGVLRATAPDGKGGERSGENRLRPLPPLSQGPLEVVIFLR